MSEKVRHYARILRDAARRLDPNATSTPGAAFQVVEDGLPLVYRDTNTTRAGLTALNSRFRGHTIAIVGVGGTGSYILDQVAKTWVDRILLFKPPVREPPINTRSTNTGRPQRAASSDGSGDGNVAAPSSHRL